MIESLSPLLASAVAAAIPLFLASLGELVTERSGVLNLGLEGMMLVGALAAFAATNQLIPWKRVYRVPDDVYWQHATHLGPDITCAMCHGPVSERDVIAQETNITSMKGCMTCHEQRQVYTDCGDCHEPRQ